MITSKENFSHTLPSNDTIQIVINNDKVRYQRKGYGLIIASLILVFYFFVLPSLVKNYLWGYFLQLGNTNTVYFILFIANHEFVFLIGNLMFFFIYTLKLQFFEKYRISPERKWPWEEDQKKWKSVLMRTIKYVAIAHLILIPSFTLLDIVLGLKFKMETSEFPTTLEFIFQIIFFMICEDFTFYWSHRTLHHKSLYPYIHKIHHEYNNPISVSSEFAHPIEFVLANMLPNAVGSKILGSRVHLATYLLWVCFRVMETLDGHSGYEFSWSPYRLLPLSGSANYHNFHHTHNVGNYGSFFMIWDTVFGTNKQYFEFIAQKEKIEGTESKKIN